MYSAVVVIVFLSGLFLVMVFSDSTQPSTKESSTPSTTSTTLWPPSVLDCYEDLAENGYVKYCEENCKKKYTDDDLDKKVSEISTSSSSTPVNHNTISCYILYDTLECLDHEACGLCPTNESLIFHQSVRRKAKTSRAVGGQCHGVPDYNRNRSRCLPSPPPDNPSTKTDAIFLIDETSIILLILIVFIMAVAISVLGIILTMMWHQRSDFLIKTFRDLGGGGEANKLQGSASTTACGYGPADFMSQKGRKNSLKRGGGRSFGLGMFHLSPMKNTPNGKQKQSLEQLKHSQQQQQQQQQPLPKRKVAAAPKVSKRCMQSVSKMTMAAASQGSRVTPKTRSLSKASLAAQNGKSSGQKTSSSSAASSGGGGKSRNA